MTKDEAIVLLKKYAEYEDEEEAHVQADRVLLALVNDSHITRLFNNIQKWYA